MLKITLSRYSFSGKFTQLKWLLVVGLLSSCATAPKRFSDISASDLSLAEINKTNFEKNIFVDEFPNIDVNQIAANNQLDVFKTGDTAEVEVYNVEQLSANYVVDRAGNIVFPLIGTVRVSGLSRNFSEARRSNTR